MLYDETLYMKFYANPTRKFPKKLRKLLSEGVYMGAQPDKLAEHLYVQYMVIAVYTLFQRFILVGFLVMLKPYKPHNLDYLDIIFCKIVPRVMSFTTCYKNVSVGELIGTKINCSEQDAHYKDLANI